MSFFAFLGYGFGVVAFVYLAARLGSAAFFESKRQYERMKNYHGTQKQA